MIVAAAQVTATRDRTRLTDDVDQSGGWITVDSDPGRGATFSVYFPRVSESDLRTL